MCECCDKSQGRQDERGPNQAFLWGFFFSFWGLVIVAITKDDYPKGVNPLTNAIMGFVGSWLGLIALVILYFALFAWEW